MPNLEDTIRSIQAASAPTIVQNEVKGFPGTGFEKAGDKGPFECGNCSHMKNGYCYQKTMMKYIKISKALPMDAKGHPVVSEHDCCEYVDRMGE